MIQTKIPYKSIALAFLATMVRYYDYGLFGLSAAMLAKAYLPATGEDSQLLGFFGIFSASVVLRPVGSGIFGKIGDKIGRTTSVKVATILAAVSTIGIGLIPSYSSIGLWAVLLLIFMRIMFLVSLAGEIDAIKIYIAELVGKKRRFFTSSLVTFSAQIGVLIAASCYHFASSLGEGDLMIMGVEFWRFNFIAGGLVGIIVFLLRGSLIESEVFLKDKGRVDIFDDMNLFQIANHHRLKFALSTVINGMLGGTYHFLIIFLATFAAKEVHILEPAEASALNVKLITIYGLASIAAGVVADRVSYYRQVISALLIAIAVLLLMIFRSDESEEVIRFHKMILLVVPFFMVPTYIKIQSLYRSKVRMRMCSLSHSLGSMIFSSTTPLLCMFLWKMTNNFNIVLSFFMVQMVVILLAILLIYRQNYANEFDI